MTTAILVAASIFRIWLWRSEGGKWSAADETVMARLGLAAAAPGYSYRRACHDWLAHPEAAKWPGVVRYGNVLLLGLVYKVVRRNSYYIPSSISTASSVGTLWLSWLLTGSGSPWVALAVAFSPLQMHLGRRALQDQLVACLTLASLWCGLHGHMVAAGALAALLVAVKETTALHMLALGVAWLTNGTGITTVAATLAAGSLGYFLGFVALTREPLLLWRLAMRLMQARHDSYGVEHQQGTFHRLPADLLLLAPAAAFIAARADALTPVIVFGLTLVAVQSCIPILRSVRMVTAADAAMHVAAATVAGPLAAVCIAASNLYVFWRVFQRGKVYDPITLNLVTALGFAPPRD